MTLRIDLSPDEVEAAVLAYLISRGYKVAAVRIAHAIANHQPVNIEHNYDSDRFTLRVEYRDCIDGDLSN